MLYNIAKVCQSFIVFALSITHSYQMASVRSFYAQTQYNTTRILETYSYTNEIIQISLYSETCLIRSLCNKVTCLNQPTMKSPMYCLHVK